MEHMNKLLISIAIVLLTGCAVAPYNPVEHWELTKLTATLSDTSQCGTPTMPARVGELNSAITSLYLYTSDDATNKQVSTTLGLAKASIEEMQARYTVTAQISKTYCVEKLTNVKLIVNQAREQASRKPTK
jgi:hypothetical protein